MMANFTTRTADEVLMNLKMTEERIEATNEAIKKAEGEGMSPKMLSVLRQSLAALGAKKEVYVWMLVD